MIDLRNTELAASDVAASLGLEPHPEGGHFRETWRAAAAGSQRGASTAILFLLSRGERSHWHRVDADEIWIWQAGAALALGIAGDNLPASETLLGPGLIDGQRPHDVVPAGRWQAARSTGAWSLVCCVVAPAFRFDGFELAPPGWSPP